MATEYSIQYKLKEVVKHSIIYGITSSLQSVLGFILLPILTQYYSTNTFGVYSIILLIAAFANAIFYLGASSALGRYYFEEDSEHYKKQIITTTFIISLFGAAILVLLSTIINGYLSLCIFNTTDYAFPISLALIGAAFGFLLTTMTVVLRYQKKSKTFLITTILGVLLNFIITYIGLTKFNLEILAPLYGTLISNLFCLLVLVGINTKIFTLSLSKKHFTLISIFGIQLSVSSLLFYILEWADRLIINDLLSLSEVGVYSLGYRIASLLNILLVLPFSLIWAPIRMQYVKNANSGEFMTKITSYYTIAGLVIIFFALLFGEEAMRLFFKNSDYYGATKIFPIIMLSILFYGYQNILDFGIYLSGKLYYFTLVSIICIITNIGLNYLLIPKFGYIAAAYVNLITYATSSSMIYLISNAIHQFKLEWGRILGPIAFIYLCSFILNVEYSTLFLKYVIKVVILIIGVCALLYLWLNEKEKEALRSMYSNKKSN